jgi:hypothetical protein
MALLMQRLRTLQLRLNSVDPVAKRHAVERVLEWRAVKGEMKARENRRAGLQKYVIAGATEATYEFADRFETEFLPRLTASFETLIPEVERRAAAVSESRAIELEDEFAGRLTALERRNAQADLQLAELREACAGSYRRFAEVNDRLDRIWEDQEAEGIGGWRIILRKANTEKDANEKTPLEIFREEQLGEDEFDSAETPGLICPVCAAPRGRRKPRTGLMDDLLGLVGVSPYQCKRCLCRFYRLSLRRRR